MTPGRRRTLVARLDSAGDVILAGPAIRAVARTDDVVLLTSSRGAAAGDLLPGVAERITFDAPWILADPAPVDRGAIEALVGTIAGLGIDRAILLTSARQSALPLALVLRLARVGWVGACSNDYPGTLLDVHHIPDEDVHEVERSLALVAACGHRLPADDRGELRLVPRRWSSGEHRLPRSYVVVHPGASASARTWSPDRFANLVEALRASGRSVVVTGGPDEAALTALVAGPAGSDVVDLGGRLDLGGLARVIAGADAVVVGDTGPAHIAAAVDTPVVSLFAPTVPARRWRPWMVRHVLLGDHGVPCAGCRVTTCPFEGHPCLAGVTVSDAARAVEHLTGPEHDRWTRRVRARRSPLSPW